MRIVRELLFFLPSLVLFEITTLKKTLKNAGFSRARDKAATWSGKVVMGYCFTLRDLFFLDSVNY